MTSVFIQPASRTSIAVAMLFTFAVAARAQDPQLSAIPQDEKARQRIEREARKAADEEEKSLRAASEKERREAEASTRTRDKGASRLSQEPVLSPGADSLSQDQDRVAKAEEKARAEAEKARKREEDRVAAQEAKDNERRRRDEERAEKEAAKARDNAEKNRLNALKKETEEADKNARRSRSNSDANSGNDATPASAAPQTPAVTVPTQRDETPPAGSKEDEKRRRELVKQIEKARTERDRLNREADEADRLARESRTAANEAQRGYEALTTGLNVEDIAAPATAGPEAPKRNRFVTKADERQAAAAKNSPPTGVDPLRVALDLKNPDAEQREKAAFALASLGPDAAPATRALMAALADANPSVRVAAAQALGRIGPAASAALAPLSAALTDPDPAVKNAAQAALLSIQNR